MSLPALRAHPEYIAGEQAALMLRCQVPADLASEEGRAWLLGAADALVRMARNAGLLREVTDVPSQS